MRVTHDRAGQHARSGRRGWFDRRAETRRCRRPAPAAHRARELGAQDIAGFGVVLAARRIERETTSPLSPDDKDAIHRLLYRLVQELNPDALAIDTRSLN
jgi:hypothetical protein